MPCPGLLPRRFDCSLILVGRVRAGGERRSVLPEAERVQEGLRVILGGRRAALGKRLHYVTRLELRRRGSVHGHIALWVDPADV